MNDRAGRSVTGHCDVQGSSRIGGVALAFLTLLITTSSAGASALPAGTRAMGEKDLISRVERALNENPSAVIFGGTEIPSDSTHRGPLYVADGSLVVSGMVYGEIIVIGGDLSLRGKSSVMGETLVIGGKIFSSKLASIRGEIEVYDFTLSVEHTDEGYVVSRGETLKKGGISLELRGFKGFGFEPYNRVDGLPLKLHAVLKNEDSRLPWQLQLKTMYRIAAHRWGWDARWEAGTMWERYRFGVGYSQKTVTNDLYRMSDFENTIAAIFFSEDFRNYYEKEAVEGWFELQLLRDLSLGVRFETADNRSRPTMAEFSIFGWNKEFRENPPVDEGRSNSMSIVVTHDSRDNEMAPESGWYNRLIIEKAGDGLGGDFDFTRYEVQLRRYNRIGHRVNLDFRLFFHYGADPLPTIRHLSFGGVGGLRGYPDSIAGGDRVLLGSAEFRYLVTEGIEKSVFFRDGLDIVAFFDTGDAVAAPDDLSSESLKADVGAGVSGSGLLSYLGVFIAQSITDTDLDPRLTVRVTRDF